MVGKEDAEDNEDEHHYIEDEIHSYGDQWGKIAHVYDYCATRIVL